MSSIRSDTIGGFNAFLSDQRDETGSATVSLFEFNTSVSLVYQGMEIEEAPELDENTYVPGGQTALHDAISTAVNETASDMAAMEPATRPENVIVVVLTDGKENASETPADQVRNLVTTYRKEHDWEFLFIGANQDAALAASEMGMDADHSLDMAHSGEGTRAAYESTSERVSRAREEGSTGGFDDDDRDRQQDADGS
ncbi:von Willebrand factor type A domain-containing protein [Halorubrum ezzemoulense]|uniref:von Willebrand factor type A domain-containing protein n=2 Tax=Halorubrum ezzemoulense TaxID=337243 RepID=A0A238Y210_HALEZ|nr:von Willebrand factor type A domain-containing protein [Halorubrum ezzemoulense]